VNTKGDIIWFNTETEDFYNDYYEEFCEFLDPIKLNKDEGYLRIKPKEFDELFYEYLFNISNAKISAKEKTEILRKKDKIIFYELMEFKMFHGEIHGFTRSYSLIKDRFKCLYPSLIVIGLSVVNNPRTCGPRIYIKHVDSNGIESKSEYFRNLLEEADYYDMDLNNKEVRIQALEEKYLFNSTRWEEIHTDFEIIE